MKKLPPGRTSRLSGGSFLFSNYDNIKAAGGSFQFHQIPVTALP